MLIDSANRTTNLKQSDQQILTLINGKPALTRIDQVVPVFESEYTLMAYEGTRTKAMLFDGRPFENVESTRSVNNVTVLSVAGQSNRRWILHSEFRESITRWGIKTGTNLTTTTISANASKLMSAFNSGERLNLPPGIVCIGGEITIPDIHVNIEGASQWSVLRQMENTNGIVIDNTSRLNEVSISNLIVESSLDFINGVAISIKGSIGNSPLIEDNIVTKCIANISNVTVRGSDMYVSGRPWKKGWKGGLYIENPQSVNITDFFMQGRGERYVGENAWKNSDYGIYLKADRLSTDTIITNPRIFNIRTGIDLLGDAPVGKAALEGVKILSPTIVSTHIGVRIMNTRYGAPLFEIKGGTITADRYCIFFSNIRQSFVDKVLFYHFGHDEPGIAAQIYLANATSDTFITHNNFKYFNDRGASKKPYGILAAGFNKETFYGSADIAGTGIEFSVGNKIFGNSFTGPGADVDVAAIWMQDTSVNNEIDLNNGELYKTMIRADAANNRIGRNHPASMVQGGIVPIVNNEQEVITIPKLDANNDPVIPAATEKVIVNRANEGAVLVPYSGTVIANTVADSGLLVAITVGTPIANGYVLDAQFARSELIRFRPNYVSSIDSTDPENPVMVTSPFTGKLIVGLAGKWGDIIRLETDVPITLRYDANLLPLRGKRDFVLKPGMHISFMITRYGVEEINRTLHGREELFEITLSDPAKFIPEGKYYYDDSALLVANRIGRETNGYPWFIDILRNDNIDTPWAIEIARNYFSGRTLQRQRRVDGSYTPWIQSWAATAAITQADNEFLQPGFYTLVQNIYPDPAATNTWHLEVIWPANQESNFRYQRATHIDTRVKVDRVRDNTGTWSAWKKIENLPVAISNPDADLEPGWYTVSAALFPDTSGSNVWHMQEIRPANQGGGVRAQWAKNITTGLEIERSKAGGGAAWSAWKRVGSKAMALGANQLPDGTFGVAMKPATTNVQLYYQDGLITRELIEVPTEATTINFLLGYNIDTDKRHRLTPENVKTSLDIGWLNGIETLVQLKEALDALP